MSHLNATIIEIEKCGKIENDCSSIPVEDARAAAQDLDRQMKNNVFNGIEQFYVF